MPKKTKDDSAPIPRLTLKDLKPLDDRLEPISIPKEVGGAYLKRKKAELRAMVNRFDSKELALTISPMERLLAFKVEAGINKKRFDFYVHVPLFNIYEDTALLQFSISSTIDEEYSPLKTVKKYDPELHGPRRQSIPEYGPINMAIHDYQLSHEEHTVLLKAWYPNKRGPRAKKYVPDIDTPYDRMDLKGLEYFGELLKRILEDIGYEVVVAKILKPDIPIPIGVEVLLDSFMYGLKISEPEVKRDRDITTVKYLWREKDTPKASTKLGIQLTIFDRNLEERRLQELHELHRNALTPRGLQIMAGIFKMCELEGRTFIFPFNTNRFLEVMKYPKSKKGYHYQYHRTEITKQIEDLSQVQYTVERIFKRQKEPIVDFTGPVVFITPYKITTYESLPNNATSKGQKLKDDHFIMLHPELYRGVLEGDYGWLPDAIFTIPANKFPYAIPMCFYLSTQQKLGWDQYGGVIDQSVEQFLKGAGIYHNLPKQGGKWKTFIEKRIQDLRWMSKDKGFWIKKIRFERKGFMMDHRIIIEPSGDIPLRKLLKEQNKNLQGLGTKST